MLLAVGYQTSHDDLLRQAAGFALAGVATLIIFPIARAPYFVVMMPGVMFLSLWLVKQDCPRRAVAYAVVPVVLIAAQYALVDTAGRLGVLGIGTTLWYFGVCIAMLRIRHVAAAQDTSRFALPPEPMERRAAA